ncbi:hypothetical protein K1728_05480 [Weissella confusa]|uniref:hypothetical protein n=1 Tax=Weissella confusa TaxID=1583 RepID=UPI001C6F9790|nr:hypothetical protein [Weissella confusa]QYU58850.1 hypothetical protein K1728_05480 [Weissella confusa]
MIIHGVVFADDSNSVTSAITSGDMSTIANHIDRFRIYHADSGMIHPVRSSQYGMAEFIWGIVSSLYGVVDYAIWVLFSSSADNGLTSWITTITNGMFDYLKTNILGIVFTVVVTGAALIFVNRGRAAGFKEFLRIIGTLLLAFFWFASIGNSLTKFSDFADNVSSGLVQGVVKVENKSLDGNESLITLKNQSDSASQAQVVRASYFTHTLYPAWTLVNFGVQKAQTSRLSKFLDKNLSDDDVSSMVSDKANKEGLLKYMQLSNAPYQLSTAFAAIFPVIIYGLPYLALGLARWIITLLAFVLILGTPVLLVASLFPRWQGAFKNGIVKILVTLIAKGLLALVLVVFATVDVVVKAITSVGDNFNPEGTAAVSQWMFESIIWAILIIVLWYFRSYIVSTVTGGLVNTVGNNSMLNRGDEYISRGGKTAGQKFMNVVEGGLMGAGGYFLGKRAAEAEENQKEQQLSDFKMPEEADRDYDKTMRRLQEDYTDGSKDQDDIQNSNEDESERPDDKQPDLRDDEILKRQSVLGSYADYSEDYDTNTPESDVREPENEYDASPASSHSESNSDADYDAQYSSISKAPDEQMYNDFETDESDGLLKDDEIQR